MSATWYDAMIRSLKAFFNYGTNLYDLSIENPVSGLQLYNLDHKIKYIPLNEDIEPVKAICTKIQRFVIDLCLESGCRADEALNLRMADVEKDYVMLYTRKARHPNLSARKLPGPPCLNGYNPEADRIFGEYTTSQPPRFLVKDRQNLGQKPWGFRSLRHRVATLAIKNTMPLIELMYRLGHSNLSATQIYLHEIGWTEFVVRTFKNNINHNPSIQLINCACSSGDRATDF
jgi:integrase